VNFTAFAPCPDAAVGTVWYLTDTREAANPQTYKVKKLADGHIWMVQDMKFGDLCGTSFTGSTSDQKGHVSSIGEYYGDCTAATSTNTPSMRGYLYDWAAAINKPAAYLGSPSDVGCAGTVSITSTTGPSACQGICPAGWHVPTGGTGGEYAALVTYSEYQYYAWWVALDGFDAILGGRAANDHLFYQCTDAHYFTSTMYDQNYAYYLSVWGGKYLGAAKYDGTKSDGLSVRCVLNY
jgi:uncharacterized protein (TIGR02145 family)